MGTLLLALVLLAADDFELVEEVDGIAVSTREVRGSGIPEVRFVTTVSGDFESLCARAFGTGKIEPGDNHVVARKVLSESADERVTHDELDPPVVSRRDYVVRRTRTRPSPSVCRIDFASLDDAPETEGIVRLKQLRGSTVIEKASGGKLRVEYRVHTDPGGALPSWLVKSQSRKASLDWFRELLKAAKAPSKR